jgi:hypothetical protein
MAEYGEYGPDVRYRYLEFGKAGYTDPSVEGDINEPLETQVVKAGWSNGCPSVRQLAFSPSSQYGPEWMLHRYLETNSYGRKIAELAKRFGAKGVYRYMTEPVLRLPGEDRPGKYEPLSVPASHLWQISPMSGPVAYGSTRVAIEIRGREDKESASRRDVAEEVTYRTLLETWSMPNTFLALLGERAVRLGLKIDAEIVLGHIYDSFVLEEENITTYYVGFANILERVAPTLWQVYNNLRPDQRKELGIAEVPIRS